MSNRTNDSTSPTDADPDAPDRDPPTGARVLKGGAVVFAVLGTVIAGWMADKWIRYPSMQASQFDFSAPLWPAATLFVGIATVAGVALLWRAAQRAESGEDLFAQRHRRSIDEAGRHRKE